MSPSDLKILVADENRTRASIIKLGLIESGYLNVEIVDSFSGLALLVQTSPPDVIIVDLENPQRDTLEAFFALSRAIKRPIAMFVDQSDLSAMEEAIDAGVSAYVVDGLKKDRIRPIMEMAIARFRAFSRMEDELFAAKSQLKDQSVVTKAKEILMDRKGLSESEAHRQIRTTAMNKQKKMSEIASSIVLAAEAMDL
ncbi:ANTAR domain-containing protein [Cohaesibacter sp. CAU 1516]|uniref:ANTAR domain-containing response regulator n=1 Tax=Cohaesibacter sp. CAU 1516 TaxID=2576038 RepID=UPI0010FD62CC|nr:ANTAR domain-containing protein [Cohaesibacter sp. CAU 1516]TLP44897.1 ANTAR domain-containing protein [Cohaesibacter sp. CAU 1516]